MSASRKFDDKTKWCPCCEQHLPLDSFGRKKIRVNSPSGRQGYCKGCNRQKQYQYNQKYLAKTNKKGVYGITWNRVIEMWHEQKGVCGICSKAISCPSLKSQPRKGGTPVSNTDHCHRTNKVRGLLCTKCNLGLGCFDDSPALMALASAYIMKHTTLTTL